MSNLQLGLRDVFAGLSDSVGAYLPNLIAALLILVVGWLAALLLSKLVRAGLKKTTLDNRIAGWLTGSEEVPPAIEPAIGRVIFWILMVFVLVLFFEALKLTAVTGPLNAFLNQIFEYAPRLLSAALLLLIAWLVATGLRLLVRSTLRAAKLDERVGSAPEKDKKAEKVSLTHMLSETVYWLVFLFFLPLILDALALDGLLTPVRSMVGKVLDFLPHLFAATIIFLIGWFLARIIQRIVSNLLAAVGLDRLGDRTGINKVLGEQRLSGLLGIVVYALVLIPVLIAALNALQLDAITRPASAMLDRILQTLPQMFGAVLVLTIAYIIARVVASLVTNVLRAAGFESALERLGLKWKAEGGDGASGVVGKLVIVVIMLFAAIEAMELLDFQQVAGLVTSFTVFLGNVLLGLAIFGLGLYLASLAYRTIRASGGSQAPLLASVSRIAIVVLAGAMALRQMEVAEDIINLAFGLLLGSAAVAAAIAFGIGGRDLAKKELEGWSKTLR